MTACARVCACVYGYTRVLMFVFVCIGTRASARARYGFALVACPCARALSGLCIFVCL